MFGTFLYVLSQVAPFSYHVHDTRYTRTSFEAACGEHVIKVVYRNGTRLNERGRAIRDWGRVEQVAIDGRLVPGLAEDLENRVARRGISRVEIAHCGLDERKPLFQGLLETSSAQSTLLGASPNVFFRIEKVGGVWRTSFKYVNG